MRPSTTPEASLLALLGRIFARELDRELLAVLQTAQVAELFSQSDSECGRLLSRPWNGDDFETAAVEYCRLFIAPQVAAPVASAWLGADDTLGASAVSDLVHNTIGAFELDIPKELRELPPDHIGVVLSISAWLVEHRVAVAPDFMDQALATWAGRFSSALIERSEFPLYRACGKVVQAFLTDLPH